MGNIDCCSTREDIGYDHLYKVMIVGDTMVGKTLLWNRYIKGVAMVPISQHLSTTGVEFAVRTVPLAVGGVVKAVIWDTAGDDDQLGFTTAHYRRAVGALLLYDITRYDTFRNCEKWLRELRRHAEPNIDIVLVGNKRDLVDEDPRRREVAAEVGMDFARRNKIMFGETSASTSTNVREVFQRLLQEIYNQSTRLKAVGTDSQFTSARGPATSARSSAASRQGSARDSARNSARSSRRAGAGN